MSTVGQHLSLKDIEQSGYYAQPVALDGAERSSAQLDAPTIGRDNRCLS